jgi:phosphoserine phosphatase RsbU/P
MIRASVEEYTWDSHATIAAELTPDGMITRGNSALERLSEDAVGRPFAGLLAAEQRDAFERRLAEVEESWTSATFAFASGNAGAASDRLVWLRRSGAEVLVVAEPATGEQERLVEKVLELNDELVVTHRELVRQREDLRRAAERIRNLEAISAAGLSDLRLDELLAEVLRLIARAVGSDRAVLLLREDDELVARAAVGLRGVKLQDIRVPVGAGVAGGIAVDGEPRLIDDLSTVTVHSAYLRESSRSMAAVPLSLDDEVFGVLHVTSDEPARFGEDDLSLLVPAAERAALAIGRARVIERERNIAETLQRALLPDALPDIKGLELAARFAAGANVEVGGDWYDAYPLPSGELAVVIGDVAGKGLPAATLMGELRAGLRAYALEGGTPIETLARLNRLAERSFQMATVALLLIDPLTGAARFGSAGHLPPLRLDSSGRPSFLLGGASAPLLAFDGDVEPVLLALDPGDRVLLYTDGLVERRREAIDDSLARLQDAAGGFRGSLDELCDHLMTTMSAGSEGPRDDTAVIALERR